MYTLSLLEEGNQQDSDSKTKPQEPATSQATPEQQASSPNDQKQKQTLTSTQTDKQLTLNSELSEVDGGTMLCNYRVYANRTHDLISARKFVF